MKILVTGGTGFLGSHLVGKLKSLGHKDVSSLSRKEGTDIKDYARFRARLEKIRPDIILHCAAHSGGIAYNAQNEVEIFEDNTLIGINVAKACNELGINRLINAMPNCVYPGHLQEYEESKFWDGPLHESVLTVGLPRKVLWGSCFAYCRRNPEFRPVSLIFPNLYGPGDEFEPVQAHALGALVSKIVDARDSSRKTVEIWGTGRPVREWLYAEDAAESMIRTMEKMDRFEPNEIMNIGVTRGGVTKGISIKELAMLIKEAAGWDGKFIFNTEKPDGAERKVLIAKKMKEKLGWEPPTRLEDGIRKTVEWYEKHRRQPKPKK